MHLLDTVTSQQSPAAPDPGTAGPPGAACLLLRLRTATDPDALADQLSRLCRQLPGGRRAAPAMAVSVVQTCGRSAAERERDALRLLETEARATRCATSRPTVRATLVSIGADEHLLLLAVAPDAAMERLLATLAGELARLYPGARPAATFSPARRPRA